MLLLFRSLLDLVSPPEPPEPPQQAGGGIVKKPRKPQRARYEVDSFTNFMPQPIVKKDDNDYIILMMMQGG